MEPIRLPVTSRQRPVARRPLPPLFSPDVFDFWASRLSRTWSWDRRLARVVERRAASSDAVTLVLQPNRHFRGYTAGQHVNVTVEVDGRRLTRSYSPSAAPRADGRIEITVKAVEGGRVSQHLVGTTRAGDVLELGPAFGAMALPADEGNPLMLLAAGSGITPLMAIIRSLPRSERAAPVTLLYWARTRAELCFVDELRALAASRGDFTVRFLLTGEGAEAQDEGEGRLCAAHVGNGGDACVFACGPAGFVELARTLLETEARTFLAEAFTPPVFASDDAGTVAVKLSRSGRTLTLPRGQALLAALEAEGVVPESGCRMGICNTCACGKRSGATRHLGSGVIDNEPASALRLCVHSATSDLELDL